MFKVLLFVCLAVLTAAERLGENFALEPEVYKPKKSAPQPFPKTCEGGVIDLQGVYDVNEDMVIRGCNLTGRGAKGATIFLQAHLTFEQRPGSEHQKISWVGAIRFVGKQPLKQACVTVRGHLVIGGEPDRSPDANIQFASCHNKDKLSNGGALHVVNGLTMRSGFVMIQDSSSAGGGGLYIHGNGLHQKGGKVVLKDCGSDGFGGGLLINSAGDFQQDAGEISCIGCFAAQRGGCMVITGSANIAGSIHAQNCSAGLGGGVSCLGELVSSGLMEFAWCRAKAGGGGGLQVESDFIQHAGSMEFRSCTAAEDGGAMALGKNLTTSGTMEFYACHADGDGGAIKLQGDLQQQAAGNMSFASCTARRGGAVAVRRLEASGTMEFKDCNAEDSGGAAVVGTDFVQNAGRIEFQSCTADKGGALVVPGDLVSHGLCSIKSCFAEQGSALEVLGDFLVTDLPTDCPDGVLDLTGMYVVDWVSTFVGNCKIRGTGATVLIKEPLVVEGAVEFLGLISFIGLSPMEQACVTVKGSLTIGGTSDETDILFTDCHNKDSASAGGALHIAQDLTVVSGVLEIERSSSLKGGGGVYIDSGSLYQVGGSIKMMSTSTSADIGGGLLVNRGSVVQADGQISCHKCSAKRGGCLALNGGVDNYSLQSNGSIEAESCTAGAGGALHISTGHWLLFGHIIFNRCRAEEGPGGAAWVRGSIYQMKGTVTFASCTAAGEGGGMKATGSFVQEEGSVSCQACNSQRGGGCMHVVDKFVQKSGSAIFTACNTSRNGGALSVENGVYLGGNSTFQDCSSTGHDGGCLHTKGHVDFQGSALFTGCEAARDGGAVSARSAEIESGASVTFDSCRAGWSGGGLYLQAFHQTGGSVMFAFCRTNVGSGGGLYLRGDFRQDGGHTSFYGCEADNGKGGGLRIEKGSLIQSGGNLDIKKCKAGGAGGGGDVEFDVVQQGGKLSVAGCHSLADGGCMRVSGNFTQESRGVAHFSDCLAKLGGGCLGVKQSVHVEGSSTFKLCKASGGLGSLEPGGGGLLVHRDFFQNGGVIRFESCKAARGFGGGLQVLDGNLTAASGDMFFVRCWAQGAGGAHVKNGHVHAQAFANVHFESCKTTSPGASGGGMGLQLGSLFQQGGHIRFSSCRAPGGKGGGLALLQGSLHQYTGSLGFERCGSGEGGGLFVRKDVLMAGALNFSNCKAHRQGGGGGAVVKQDFLQHAGELLVDSCSSNTNGGGLFVGGTFNQVSNTSARFAACRARAGGCLGVNGSVYVSGSNTFEQCVAFGDAEGAGGGGIYTQQNFSQLGGITNFTECRTLRGGGALRIKSGSLIANSGTLIFGWCRAANSGGGAKVGLHVYVRPEAKMFFRECGSYYFGGGMFLSGHLIQDGGSMKFHSCQASHGGGLAVSKSYLHQLAGEMHLVDCHAGVGGGLWVQKNMTVGSSVALSKCSARSSSEGGGCVYIDQGDLIVKGNASMENCSSLGSGGGLLMGRGGVRQQAGSNLSFRHCSARGGNGGGMSAYSFASQGFAEFASCAASSGGGSGGGFYISSGHGTIQQSRGRMSFTNCTAGQRGGGFYLGSAVPGSLRDISFDRCSTDGDAGTFYAESRVLNVSNLTIFEPRSVDFDIISEGKLALQDLHLHSRNRKFGMGIWAGSLDAGTVNCTLLKWCSLVAPEPHVHHLHCPPGTGIQGGDNFSNCSVCEDNFTALSGDTQSKCVPCPTHNDFCYADKFKMTPGHMVQKNISLTIFCPNPAACPGGNSTKMSTMCAEGYQDRACANCSQGYSISDSSVLICTHCATDFWRKLLQWAYMLAKHFLPFAVAAYSALQVEDAEEPKRSGVLINQLLSFATVASTLLTMVAQTNAMREVKLTAAGVGQALLRVAGFTTDFISGQGASEGSFGISSTCLLSYLGLRGTLWQAHLLHTAIPAALVLILVAFLPRNQHGVAVVVGLNCFWPVIFSYFGKHLYCFQFAPQGTLELEKTYECPFLEKESHRHIVRILMVCVFVAVSYVWISLSLPKEGAKPPLHVIFLSRAYRQSCGLWESERLMRKTLLTLAVSALPITSSPALQLVCIGGVVMVSLYLHAALLPYKTMRFNLTECTLLTTAALMTAIVSGLTAYDCYWGLMLDVEFAMIFSTVGLAALTCGVMIFMIVRELVRERRNRRAKRGVPRAKDRPAVEAPWLWGTYLARRT
ncbi:unnamed protein product [Symbiodinium sp. CCMP2592]|nr:unnamed protein product [Symbiodinium sp. CCMP2592]